MDDASSLFAEILAAPLGATIASVGQGVAEAQAALDAASLQATLDLYDQQGDEAIDLLREIGYQPTFYTLPETVCEVKVSVRLASDPQADSSTAKQALPNETQSVQLARTSALERRSAVALAPRLYATSVDAGFQQRYGYQAEAAAKLTFKIVPVPPPAGLENLRRLPDVSTLDADEAVRVLQDAGYAVRLQDAQGDALAPDAEQLKYMTVSSQNPGSDSPVLLGSIVELELADNPKKMKKMPKVVGLKAKDAGHELQKLGYQVHLVGPNGGQYELDSAKTLERVVKSQDPEADSLVYPGQTVELVIVTP